MVMPWPAIDPIPSHRLLLDPLTMSAAEEMVSVLEDPELYEYTGGRAPTLEQLRTQYATQVAGRSEDGAQWWLNWVVRWRHSKEPAGYVQARLRTIMEPESLRSHGSCQWLTSGRAWLQKRRVP